MSELTAAEMALDTHRKARRKTAVAAGTRPLADRAASELRKRLPDMDPGDIAAVLLHAASYIGTEIVIALADDGIRLDPDDQLERYVLMTANAMALAGERLYRETA